GDPAGAPTPKPRETLGVGATGILRRVRSGCWAEPLPALALQDQASFTLRQLQGSSKQLYWLFGCCREAVVGHFSQPFIEPLGQGLVDADFGAAENLRRLLGRLSTLLARVAVAVGKLRYEHAAKQLSDGIPRRVWICWKHRYSLESLQSSDLFPTTNYT